MKMEKRSHYGLLTGAGVVLGMFAALPVTVLAQCGAGALITEGGKLSPANLRPVVVLSQLDMNNDTVPDGVPDTDGDGLPDNWEERGADAAADMKVGFYAPTAIGPGTPSVFLTARLIVFTDAAKADSDDDGLTDFIEVFGLKYIDDNGNGRLDFIFTDSNANGRWDPGESVDPASEWMDFNNDGLPSIGEYPLQNLGDGRTRDFDGFVFTDPLLADTDGDGENDCVDPDPLINPQTFGVPVGGNFSRKGVPASDRDLDNDGLGNGSDFGNDTRTAQHIDFPQDIEQLVKIFRRDRLEIGTLPESLIEDLVGADWDGNGLFRITDSKDFKRARLGVRTSDLKDCFQVQIQQELGLNDAQFEALFRAGPAGRKLYGTFPETNPTCSDLPVGLGDDEDLDNPTTYGYTGFDAQVQRPGLPVQFLIPRTRSEPTLPDPRVWTILYAWRQPGFDIDGDGFVGSPANQFKEDDRHAFVRRNVVDGTITVNEELSGFFGTLCGALGWFNALAMVSLSVVWMLGRAAYWRRG